MALQYTLIFTFWHSQKTDSANKLYNYRRKIKNNKKVFYVKCKESLKLIISF